MDEALLILQPFRRFTYVKVHSPSLPLLHLHHSLFSNPLVTSRTSPGEPPMDEALLILQPYRRFTYVTAHSPIHPLFHLRHSSFSNPTVASPTSHLIL